MERRVGAVWGDGVMSNSCEMLADLYGVSRLKSQQLGRQLSLTHSRTHSLTHTHTHTHILRTRISLLWSLISTRDKAACSSHSWMFDHAAPRQTKQNTIAPEDLFHAGLEVTVRKPLTVGNSFRKVTRTKTACTSVLNIFRCRHRQSV